MKIITSVFSRILWNACHFYFWLVHRLPRALGHVYRDKRKNKTHLRGMEDIP